MSFIVAGLNGVDQLSSIEVLVSPSPTVQTKTFGEVDSSFLWNFISDSYQLIPEKGLIEEIWKGILQIYSDMLLNDMQAEFSRELLNVPISHQTKWVRFDFDKYIDLSKDPTPDMESFGFANKNITYFQPMKYIKNTAINKLSLDRLAMPLRGTLNGSYTELKWEFQFRVSEFPNNSAIAFFGYFNTNSQNLVNSILVGVSGSGNLVACITGADGEPKAKFWPGVFQTSDATFKVSATYDRGQLHIIVYQNDTQIFERETNLGTGVLVNSIGMSNNCWSAIGTQRSRPKDTFSAYLLSLDYKDMSAGDTVQEIPFFQDKVQQPDILLKQNVDFVLLDGTIYFNLVVPCTSLWAEFVISSPGLVYNNFGILVDFYGEDSEEYRATIQGLWYCYLNGPTLYDVRTGLNILLQQPFAIEDGDISVIEPTYDLSTGTGRIIVGDKKEYFYKTEFGIGYKPDQWGSRLVVGDTLTKFAPLEAKAADIFDYKKLPEWWIVPYNNEISIPLAPDKRDVRLQNIMIKPKSEEIYFCSSSGVIIDYGQKWVQYSPSVGTLIPESLLNSLYDADNFDSYSTGNLAGQDSWTIVSGNPSAVFNHVTMPYGPLYDIIPPEGDQFVVTVAPTILTRALPAAIQDRDEIQCEVVVMFQKERPALTEPLFIGLCNQDDQYALYFEAVPGELAQTMKIIWAAGKETIIQRGVWYRIRMICRATDATEITGGRANYDAYLGRWEDPLQLQFEYLPGAVTANPTVSFNSFYFAADNSETYMYIADVKVDELVSPIRTIETVGFVDYTDGLLDGQFGWQTSGTSGQLVSDPSLSVINGKSIQMMGLIDQENYIDLAPGAVNFSVEVSAYFNDASHSIYPYNAYLKLENSIGTALTTVQLVYTGGANPDAYIIWPSGAQTHIETNTWYKIQLTGVQRTSRPMVYSFLLDGEFIGTAVGPDEEMIGRLSLSLDATSGGLSSDHGGVYWDRIFSLSYLDNVPFKADTMLVTEGQGVGVKLSIRSVDSVNNKVYFDTELGFTPEVTGDEQTEVYFGYQLTRVIDYFINNAKGTIRLNFNPPVGSNLISRYLANISSFSEVQKYHSFNVRLGNLNIPWLRFYNDVLSFIKRIRPTYTKVLYTDIEGQPILRYHVGGTGFVEELESDVIEIGSVTFDEVDPIPADYEDLGE